MLQYLNVHHTERWKRSMKKALVIGAGPAGLTAAYELLTKSKDIEVTIFEESDCFGGISKTVNYKGNRMDMGGHRSFSKVLLTGPCLLLKAALILKRKIVLC